MCDKVSNVSTGNIGLVIPETTDHDFAKMVESLKSGDILTSRAVTVDGDGNSSATATEVKASAKGPHSKCVVILGTKDQVPTSGSWCLLQ